MTIQITDRSSTEFKNVAEVSDAGQLHLPRDRARESADGQAIGVQEIRRLLLHDPRYALTKFVLRAPGTIALVRFPRLDGYPSLNERLCEQTIGRGHRDRNVPRVADTFDD